MQIFFQAILVVLGPGNSGCREGVQVGSGPHSRSPWCALARDSNARIELEKGANSVKKYMWMNTYE